MQKKANIASMIVFIVVLAGMAVTAPLIYKVYFSAFEELQNNTLTEKVANDTLGDFNDAMSGGLLDQGFIALFAFMTIALVVLAYVSDNALPFLIIYIILSVVFIFISIPMSNIYQELMASPEFSTIPAGAFTMTSALMGNLPLVMTVITIIASIALFARVRTEGGGMF